MLKKNLNPRDCDRYNKTGRLQKDATLVDTFLGIENIK